MTSSFQTIGWADIVISEGVRDPNDYSMGEHDPYNTDDGVVDDLFDQWIKNTSQSIEPTEEVQLAFELGAQVGMTGSYHSDKGQRTFSVDKYHLRKTFREARDAAFADFGIDSNTPMNAPTKIAFLAGYQTLSPSKGE